MPDFNSEEKLNRDSEDSGNSGEDVREEKPSVTTKELQTEIDRVAYQKKFRDTLRSTIFIRL